MTVQAIPASKGEVAKRWLKDPTRQLSVDQAKENMIRAGEAATTTAGGQKIPKHIADARATRGTGGNTPVAPYTEQEIADASESAVVAAQPSVPAISPFESGMAKVKAFLRTQGVQVMGRQPIEIPDLHVVPTITEAEIAALLAVHGKTQQASAAEPAADQPARVPADQPSKRLVESGEERDFRYDVFVEKGEWVAELRYKRRADGSTHGTERFVAGSQRELMVKLVRGKGNATLKVNEVVRGQKLGNRPDMSNVFEKELLETHNLSVEQFNALPVESRGAITDSMQANQAMLFKEHHQELHLDTATGVKNLQAVVAYLRKQNWPITERNLSIGWQDLSADNKIEDVESSVPIAPTVPVLAASSTPVVSVPVKPPRKRGSTGLIPGQSSAGWGGGADSERVRASDASKTNQGSGTVTPEAKRMRDLFKTPEGIATAKREMRATFKTPDTRNR
jgi:hypothetical protein